MFASVKEARPSKLFLACDGPREGNEKDKKGIKGLFRKTEQSLASLKAQYDKAEVNVDKIVEQLQQHQIVLMKDTAMLDKMYERNEEYQKELTMYIIAGKIKAEQLRNEELPKLKKYFNKPVIANISGFSIFKKHIKRA